MNLQGTNLGMSIQKYCMSHQVQWDLLPRKSGQDCCHGLQHHHAVHAEGSWFPPGSAGKRLFCCPRALTRLSQAALARMLPPSCLWKHTQGLS